MAGFFFEVQVVLCIQASQEPPVVLGMDRSIRARYVCGEVSSESAS